jgi:MoxR-like ATPase
MSIDPDSEAAGPSFGTPNWWIYRGTGRPLPDVRLSDLLPDPPPWRDFRGEPLPARDEPPPDDDEIRRRLGAQSQLSEHHVNPDEVDMVNAALYLRRPLLVTGAPGTGKSSLAFRIARELRLGRVLRWSITSRTTFKAGLYNYDAIGRAQATAMRRALVRWDSDEDAPAQAVDRALTLAEPSIGKYVHLGPLGTAFLPTALPRVLLIDELDKSEVDLPNDLLSIFEEGQFAIPELARIREETPEVSVFTDDPAATATVVGGQVACRAFPMIVITSNGEREFPEAFLRRCLRLAIREPDIEQLAAMVAAHLADSDHEQRHRLIQEFLDHSTDSGGLPADKLLDAVYLATAGVYREDDESWSRLVGALWRHLASVM